MPRAEEHLSMRGCESRRVDVVTGTMVIPALTQAGEPQDAEIF